MADVHQAFEELEAAGSKENVVEALEALAIAFKAEATTRSDGDNKTFRSRLVRLAQDKKTMMDWGQDCKLAFKGAVTALNSTDGAATGANSGASRLIRQSSSMLMNPAGHLADHHDAVQMHDVAVELGAEPAEAAQQRQILRITLCVVLFFFVVGVSLQSYVLYLAIEAEGSYCENNLISVSKTYSIMNLCFSCLVNVPIGIYSVVHARELAANPQKKAKIEAPKNIAAMVLFGYGIYWYTQLFHFNSEDIEDGKCNEPLWTFCYWYVIGGIIFTGVICCLAVCGGVAVAAAQNR